MTKKKLEAVRSSEAECTRDLRRQFVTHPMLQQRVRFSASTAAGATSLGWYRGHQAGVYDAYRTLKKRYPGAAKALLDAYGMKEDGSM